MSYVAPGDTANIKKQMTQHPHMLTLFQRALACNWSSLTILCLHRLLTTFAHQMAQCGLRGALVLFTKCIAVLPGKECCCMPMQTAMTLYASGTENHAEIGHASLQLNRMPAQIHEATVKCESAILQLCGHAAPCRSSIIQLQADADCIHLHGTALS